MKKDEGYSQLLALKDKEEEYSKLQAEKEKFEKEKEEFNQDKDKYILKGGEEYQGLLKKQNFKIDGVEVSYDDILNTCADDGAKRILVKKIIKKNDIYTYYNTKLKDPNKMPDDIDIIYDNDKGEWLESKDLTQSKITELNKNIGENKSSTDLAVVDKKGHKVLLKGTKYNLKDAIEGKYKKVLVING